MDEDDEDTEALRAVYGGGVADIAAAPADVEAKVRYPFPIFPLLDLVINLALSIPSLTQLSYSW